MKANGANDLRRSWIANAAAWTQAVRAGTIESRRLATDDAVRRAILRCSPRTVLDVGCGEGWLARELAGHGISVTGVDASQPLIDAARALGGAEYHVLSYAQLASDPEKLGPHFDVVVCNFSLLEEQTTPLLRALGTLLQERGGKLIVQSVHPWSVLGTSRYEDGWRVETFAGFSDTRLEPMPWYFRTFSSWMTLLGVSEFNVIAMEEPLHPASGVPLSLLLVCEPRPAAERGVAADVGPR